MASVAAMAAVGFVGVGVVSTVTVFSSCGFVFFFSVLFVGSVPVPVPVPVAVSMARSRSRTRPVSVVTMMAAVGAMAVVVFIAA